MGMYNEVYKSCPKCDTRCEIQIPQVVFGFGEFDLDYPNSYQFKDLSDYQKSELSEFVANKVFDCSNEECRHSFQVEVAVSKQSPLNVTI